MMPAPGRSWRAFPPALLAAALVCALGATDAGEREPLPGRGPSTRLLSAAVWTSPLPAPKPDDRETPPGLMARSGCRSMCERRTGRPALAAHVSESPGIPPPRSDRRPLTSRVLSGRDDARFSRPLLRAPPPA
jgi:hypothetical protein